MLQYLIVGTVSQVFSELAPQARDYLRTHLKLLCHTGGPHCPGTADEKYTPIAAIHVRRGDSCDRERDAPGPFNSMFAFDRKKGKLDRVGFRYCCAPRARCSGDAPRRTSPSPATCGGSLRPQPSRSRPL